MRICFSHSLESFKLQLTENRSKRGAYCDLSCVRYQEDLLHLLKVNSFILLSFKCDTTDGA